MRKFLLAAAAAALASPASAAVVYSNSFDAENGGNSALNYNGFSGLTVTDGTVDLIRSGDAGITCLGGSGSCVDLDGSTSNSGLISSNSFAFNAGDRVALSLFFSGNQRGGPSDYFAMRFEFAGLASGTHGYESSTMGNFVWGAFTNMGSVGMSISGIPSNLAMTDFTYYFTADTAGSVNFTLEDQGNDNVGIVVDHVSLDIGAVPEPSAWAMMILGFGVVGSAARRRKAIARAVAA